ncbi:MAG: Spy/CpxP family protein refolding chaperone [Rubrivivax sp.]|nr:Spy/CpxP family protein refolding chaperone [Rubrivivax sp.]
MKTTTQIATLTLATLTLAAAGAVFAHPGMGYGMGQGAGAGPAQGMGYGMGMGPGAGPGMGMGPGMRGPMQGPQDAAAVGARLAQLKVELKITAAQEGAWNAYAAVVQQQAEQRLAQRTQMQALMQDPQAAAALDRNAHREEMLKLRDGYLAVRGEALKNLQAVLTPEQQTLAAQGLDGGRGHRMTMRGPGR